jgi:hypothetical protein
MDTQPLSGPEQHLDHIVSDMARAVSHRRDEPQSRQSARAQVAARTILEFLPADAIEAMIAGHCVMLHELTVDSVQGTLRGEPDATRRATRNGIVAMDKAFGANLLRLEQYRARHAGNTADATPANARGETEIADRVRRHQSGTAPRASHPAPGTVDAGALSSGSGVPGEANGALPALDVPHIPDGDRPREAPPAAVVPMQGLNRQARRAIERRSRKCIDPGTSSIAKAGLERHSYP